MKARAWDHCYRAVLQADDGHTFYGPLYHWSREDAIHAHKRRAYASNRLYRLAYLIKITIKPNKVQQ